MGVTTRRRAASSGQQQSDAESDAGSESSAREASAQAAKLRASGVTRDRASSAKKKKADAKDAAALQPVPEGDEANAEALRKSAARENAGPPKAKDAFVDGEDVIKVSGLSSSAKDKEASGTRPKKPTPRSMALDSGYSESDLYFSALVSKHKGPMNARSSDAQGPPQPNPPSASFSANLPPEKRAVREQAIDAEKATGVAPLDTRKIRMEERKQIGESTGKGWFNMRSTLMTEELERDLRLLQNRSVLDPKRHYKALDWKGRPKVFQVGRVVAGAAEFYSGRMSKRETKETLADELLGDERLKNYAKRKHVGIQQRNMAGRRKGFFKKKQKR
eukprot:tig00021612_g22889.t1